MPFTPAHAAAAIPFQRTRLVSSALVIGCFSPDFEYFLRLAPKGGFGHTAAGVLALDLPISLLVFWSFHAYARESILAWIPRRVRERLPVSPPQTSIRNLQDIILVCASIIVGAATHILWDSFTHRSFWPYRHSQFLRRAIQLPVIGPTQAFKLLQYLSTALGLIVLLIWFWHWYRHTPPTGLQVTSRPRNNERSVLAFVCIAAILSAFLRGFLGVGIPINSRQIEIFLAEVATTTITTFWLGVVGYGILRTHHRPRTLGP